jgi:hypothetical protein
MGLENYRKASLWAENCPNFLAGTSPDFVAGKNFTFFRESFLSLWWEKKEEYFILCSLARLKKK